MARPSPLAIAFLALTHCGTSGPEAPEHATTVTDVAVASPPSDGTTQIATTPLVGVTPTTAAGPTIVSTCGLRAELEADAQSGALHLTLVNDGPRPVKLVVPGDGSEAGWRTPVLTWTTTRNGKPVKEREGGRCGMMNPIDASEVFTLAPGERKTISEWVGRPNVDPGTYEVELHYKNDPNIATRKGAGAGVEALLGSTDACEVRTKPTRMTI